MIYYSNIMHEFQLFLPHFYFLGLKEFKKESVSSKFWVIEFIPL